jgi:NADPH:quinone reductase
MPANTLVVRYFRTGLYPVDKFPYTLGRDGEGRVVSIGPGNSHGFKVGDRVVWLAVDSYAEYVIVPAVKVAHIPTELPEGVAVASLLQGLTALTMVRESHPVKKGDWVLVQAAAGGVGLWLCQILRAIGAKTIGTASTSEKIELAKKNGADFMIDYSKEDIAAKVKELTDGKGVIAVFDGVGKSTFDASLESLARKGTMVSFGNASGAVPPLTIA